MIRIRSRDFQITARIVLAIRRDLKVTATKAQNACFFTHFRGFFLQAGRITGWGMEEFREKKWDNSTIQQSKPNTQSHTLTNFVQFRF